MSASWKPTLGRSLLLRGKQLQCQHKLCRARLSTCLIGFLMCGERSQALAKAWRKSTGSSTRTYQMVARSSGGLLQLGRRKDSSVEGYAKWMSSKFHHRRLIRTIIPFVHSA